MALAFVTSTLSSLTALATALPVPYPASIASRDVLVLLLGCKPFNAAITTPPGWQSLGSLANGSTAAGLDTGSMLAAAFWRYADGGESGNLTVTIGSGDSCWGSMLRYTHDNARAVSVAMASGSDAAVGTAVSIAFSSNPGITVGDQLAVIDVVPTDLQGTLSAITLTATSATITAPTVQQAGIAVTTGNDSGGHVLTTSCTAGTASANATFAATSSVAANNAGPGLLVRLREVALEGWGDIAL